MKKNLPLPVRLALPLAFMLAGGAATPTAQPVAAKVTASAPEIAFTGLVVDQAAVLTPAEKGRITTRLDRFQQRTGHQFAVVTVDSLHGEDIAAFTTRLGKRWGVGRREIDDGIILLVAPNERQARIAVGRGLEEQLTDPLCASIMRWTIIPAVRKHGVAAGVDAGVTAILDQFEKAPRR
jgi:uncharacterized protein